MSDAADILLRMWNDLLARPTGPEAFRFYLQPAMAAFFGIRDGVKDARNSRMPYLKSIITGAEDRSDRLLEGLKSTSRIIILGIVMDVIYQYRVLGAFYPFEALNVTFVLAFLPYLLVRGPAERIARARRMRALHSDE